MHTLHTGKIFGRSCNLQSFYLKLHHRIGSHIYEKWGYPRVYLMEKLWRWAHMLIFFLESLDFLILLICLSINFCNESTFNFWHAFGPFLKLLSQSLKVSTTYFFHVCTIKNIERAMLSCQNIRNDVEDQQQCSEQ